MRSASRCAFHLTAVCLAIALAPARADQWNVEKSGFNLYRITGGTIHGQSIFIRVEGCDDAPDKGVVEVQKEANTRRLSFNDSTARCTLRDFLAPVEVERNRYAVLLTRDGNNNWYRVSDGDFYLKTAGCFSRAISESAELDLNRDGTGWLHFADRRQCAVEHAFKRFSP